MNVFKNINEVIDNKHYTYNIKNIDVSQYHWGSRANLFSLLEEIELSLYQNEDRSKSLAKLAADISSANSRTITAVFYTEKDTNRIILLTEVDVPNFKEAEFLSKEINITAKDNSFSFSIIEINEKEKQKIEKGELSIPDTWIENKDLNKKLKRLLFFV